jgi:beta-barrel assembly-enhancing protease
MRRAIAAILLIAGCFALYALQHAKAKAPISAAPVLYLVADTEREAERIPLALTRVGDADENKIGAQIAREYGLTSDDNQPREKSGDAATIEKYLNSVGSRLTSGVQRPQIHYHFYLDEDPYLINAFALPGGNIVVGRGLLNLLESEDELAFILGHEITHVDNRHSIERLQYELAARKYGLSVFYQLGRPGIEIFRAGYTKEQELEADRVGLGFAVNAGFSPQGAVDVMRRFEILEAEQSDPHRASSPVGELAQVSVQSLQQYFQSHPPASERLSAIESEITALRYITTPQHTFVIRSIFLTDQGEALDGAGNFSESIAHFKHALSLDASYVRAWRALAEAEWRSGDAAETVQAASEAAFREHADRDWQLLSRSLAAIDPRTAASKFDGYVTNTVVNRSDPDSQIFSTVDAEGLRYLAGDDRPLSEHLALLISVGSTVPITARVAALREISWWLYRAGKLERSAEVLEHARQLLPQDADTTLAEAWVYSDLGRQADAGQAAGAMIRIGESDAEHNAALAVISARTDQHVEANNQFQMAAAVDPVWMVARWAQNNYSASAAAVIKQLQTEELARRKKEADELARERKEAESHQRP